MTEITFRYEEATEAQPFLLPDSIWNQANGYADWALAGPAETGNVGGLQALHGLHTAITICLFTWKRREDYQGNGLGSDPKGWFGDAVDIDEDAGERPMGSLLWLLLRSPLNDQVARDAVTYASDAVQTLVDQGVVGRFVITSTADKIAGQLRLIVQAFSTAGAQIYNQTFAQIWGQEFPS